MIPAESLENFLNDTVPASDNDVMSLSANEVSPMDIGNENDIARTPRQNGINLQQFFELLKPLLQMLGLGLPFQVDFVALLQAVILTAGILLLFDLIVSLTAPTYHRKTLMVTPWLTQVLSTSWDELSHHSGPLAR